MGLRPVLSSQLASRVSTRATAVAISSAKKTVATSASGYSRALPVPGGVCFSSAGIIRRSPTTCTSPSRRPSSRLCASKTQTRSEDVEKLTLESWSHDVGEGFVTVEACSTGDGGVEVAVTSTIPGGNWRMHWAVDDWSLPPNAAWPNSTTQMDDKAVQTPFQDGRIVIHFPADEVPGRVVFVLTDGTNWRNKGAADFSVALAAPSLKSTVDGIIASEQSSCLFQRYQKALSLTGEMALVGDEGMALLYTWLRFSSNKQLRWYHEEVYNYQGKDMASTQKCLAVAFAGLAQSADTVMSRMLARMTMAGLPRGGGNGDDIRMTILHILRDNGIKEGHRPGIEDRFLQQWHQKLHSNTTPEDIAICEAYLHFLHSGNWDDFWANLWDNHGLTREDLASMKSGWRNEDGITGPACHLPQLIPAFQHLLWILKVTHSGADLDTAFQMAHGAMDDETCWKIGDLLKNRHEWWVPGKIVEIRESLQWNWKAEGASRDVLLLDIALDNYFRTVVERTDIGSLSRDDLLSMIELVLRNGVIAAGDEGLVLSLQLLRAVQGIPDRWSPQWTLQCKAALEYTGHSIGSFMDRLVTLLEPHAKALGEGCGIDRSYITNFAEEVVRGHPLGILSSLLAESQMQVADAAGLSKWQIISFADTPTAKVVVSKLSDIQGHVFDIPTVVITDTLGGLEDIPEGVVAVLSATVTDVLSHVAIRARNQGVLLASCRDVAEFNSLKEYDGKFVSSKVSVDGSVTLSGASEPVGGGFEGSSPAAARQGGLSLQAPPHTDSWVVEEHSFLDSGLVGGKSKGLAALRNARPDGVDIPSSVAIPYGSFERALEQDHEILHRYRETERAIAEASKTSPVPSEQLAAIRDVILDMSPPAGLAAQVGAAAAAANLPGAEGWEVGTGQWPEVWQAIKGVWASKWSDRAWLSRRANGVPDSSLYMAVLLQEVLPADYAFVLHTANPLTGDRDEVYGQLVVGLGEVLVGNSPGNALTFTAKSGQAPVVTAFPSKPVTLVPPGQRGIIARSDSNGEDLEEFAGAGLYDSIMASDSVEDSVDYTAYPVFFDSAARDGLTSRLAELGRSLEKAMGEHPQDVEGVVCGDQVYVVQSRPQIV
mmetsp:Transcript_22316/g.61890  ORF Transcript_22316/g.61890 Transcript_22316/m.61890 type:complete len:1108 (+) Transcript_22316:271-3594(+)